MYFVLQQENMLVFLWIWIPSFILAFCLKFLRIIKIFFQNKIMSIQTPYFIFKLLKQDITTVLKFEVLSWKRFTSKFVFSAINFNHGAAKWYFTTGFSYFFLINFNQYKNTSCDCWDTGRTWDAKCVLICLFNGATHLWC